MQDARPGTHQRGSYLQWYPGLATVADDVGNRYGAIGVDFRDPPWSALLVHTRPLSLGNYNILPNLEHCHHRMQVELPPPESAKVLCVGVVVGASAHRTPEAQLARYTHLDSLTTPTLGNVAGGDIIGSLLRVPPATTVFGYAASSRIIVISSHHHCVDDLVDF